MCDQSRRESHLGRRIIGLMSVVALVALLSHDAARGQTTNPSAPGAGRSWRRGICRLPARSIVRQKRQKRYHRHQSNDPPAWVHFTP